MNRLKILVAMLLALAPAAVHADYYVRSCANGFCTTRLVRTPIRNTANWVRTAQPVRTVARGAVQAVTTPVRGLFGRIRGYRTSYVQAPADVSATTSYGHYRSGSYGSTTTYSAPVSYGSYGSTTTYSSPVASYGSSGATTTYRTVTPSQTASSLKCDGDCNCPDCQATLQETQEAEVETYPSLSSNKIERLKPARQYPTFHHSLARMAPEGTYVAGK